MAKYNIIMNKLCSCCNKEFDNRGKRCTTCYQKQYYEKNKEKRSIEKAQYYVNNKEKIDKRSKDYETNNKDKVKAKNRTHYKNNKQTILNYQKAIKHTPKRKYGQGKKSASERNLSWNIDYDSYLLLIAQPCDYCKCSLENMGGVSLDRIKNEIGYELTNVVPCCGICNNIRNRFLTHEEMKIAMEAVLEHRKISNENVKT